MNNQLITLLSLIAITLLVVLAYYIIQYRKNVQRVQDLLYLMSHGGYGDWNQFIQLAEKLFAEPEYEFAIRNLVKTTIRIGLHDGIMQHKYTAPELVDTLSSMMQTADSNSPFADMVYVALKNTFASNKIKEALAFRMRNDLANVSYGHQFVIIAKLIRQQGCLGFVPNIISIDDYIVTILSSLSPHNCNQLEERWNNLSNEEQSAAVTLSDFQKSIINELKSEGCRQDVVRMTGFLRNSNHEHGVVT